MELQDILGRVISSPLKQPRNTWGVITNTPSEYYQNNKIDQKVLTYLYDSGPLVEDYFITLVFTSLKNRPQDLFETIRKLTPNSKVLDFGSGSGTHSIACAQKGCDVFSLDISKRMLDFAQIRFKKRGLLGHFISSLEEISGEQFDFIICDDVLEHVEDPIKVLKSFIQILKPNGLLHLDVSPQINLKKGHLPQAIQLWASKGKPILNKCFKKISSGCFQILKGNLGE